MDELSLQSFEIAGGEPALDEWHSPGRPEESDGRVGGSVLGGRSVLRGWLCVGGAYSVDRL